MHALSCDALRDAACFGKLSKIERKMPFSRRHAVNKSAVTAYVWHMLFLLLLLQRQLLSLLCGLQAVMVISIYCYFY